MNNKKVLLFIFCVLFILLGIQVISRHLSGNTSGSKSDKLQVSTSFYPLYFFSQSVGGNKADVYNITPAGSEPHDFDPTTQDIARIERGDMLVLNGGVEAWADKVLQNLKGSKVKIIIAGEGLLNKEIVEEGEKQKDPHIWLDPVLAKKEVVKITAGYTEIDPQNSTNYKINEAALDAKLDELDKKFQEGLHNCQSKDFVTSHAAFGYLASRYGLNQVAISGISPDEEPSAQQLAQVATFAKERNVKYIFFERLVSPKLSETVAHEIGAKTLVLDPIEGLSDDDIKQGKNYFTVMEENLKNLQEALQCSK